MTLQLLAKGTIVDLDLIERTSYDTRRVVNHDDIPCVRIIMRNGSWFEVDVAELFEPAKALFGLV